MPPPPSWNNITALFGGSFDPPHLGHMLAIEGLFKNPGISKVWIIPASQPPLKKMKALTHHRVQMTALTFSNLIQKSQCEILNLEINNTKNEPNFSYKTIETLKKINENIAFVIGSDQLKQFHKWYRFPEVLRLCHWIILKRKTSSTVSDKDCQIYQTIERYKAENLLSEISSDTFEVKNSNRILKVVETNAPSISSTQIRENIALFGLDDKSTEVLHPDVIEYLNTEHLYGI